jgi:hypothetical protein
LKFNIQTSQPYICRGIILLRSIVSIALGLMLVLGVLREAHLGIRGAIARHPIVRLAQKRITDLEVALDAKAPTAPLGLVASKAPVVLAVRSYLNRAHVTKHVTAPFDSTGGDLVVVYASSHGKLTFTPSDNFKNTWIPLNPPTDFGPGNDLRSALWFAKNPKTGPNHVFTIDLSTPYSLVISLFVIRGSDKIDPVDLASAIGSDADGRTATVQSPVIATVRSDELLIGFGKSAWSVDWQAGDGFALQPAASSDYLAAETGAAPTPGRLRVTFQVSEETDWQSALVAVRPDAASEQDTVTLSWQPSSDNVGVQNYIVERCAGADCNDFIPTGTSADTSFVDRTSLRAGSYRYRVLAVDAAGNRSPGSNVVAISVRTPRFPLQTKAGALTNG